MTNKSSSHLHYHHHHRSILEVFFVQIVDLGSKLFSEVELYRLIRPELIKSCFKRSVVG